MKIKYICEDCKGDNLSWDASGVWDTKEQSFIVSNIFDDLPWCQDCGEQVYTIEIPISFDELKIL